MPFDDRPFQDRESYQDCHRCLAVTENGEIVRIVDWARSCPETNLRIVVVAVADPDQPRAGTLAWHTREDALAPVPATKGAREKAAQWRAEQQADTLSRNTLGVAVGLAQARRI